MQELLKALAWWVRNQRLRITVFRDAALINEDQTGRHFFGKADFVGNDDHRHAFFRQILHNFQHFVTQLRVESRRWLRREGLQQVMAR